MHHLLLPPRARLEALQVVLGEGGRKGEQPAKLVLRPARDSSSRQVIRPTLLSIEFWKALEISLSFFLICRRTKFREKFVKILSSLRFQDWISSIKRRSNENLCRVVFVISRFLKPLHEKRKKLDTLNVFIAATDLHINFSDK